MAGLGFEPELVRRVDRLIATSEFKRQVPPIAKLGPRTAGVDYLYPRRRPGSARG
jgi:NH3-dependent NAD+ synthetase